MRSEKEFDAVEMMREIRDKLRGVLERLGMV
jgi:hypothetical protein|uniref:Uncharacterized protein n=1 Tax=Candidatus Methanophagaceae archaeon ANME-1 ERB6 TaxID=2759912 RepID=A0A7G9YTY6_9EURY|nr:hypothetical protein OGFGKJAA_00036 [Methanosarcinales archaeon ANME-1 ERB6]